MISLAAFFLNQIFQEFLPYRKQRGVRMGRTEKCRKSLYEEVVLFRIFAQGFAGELSHAPGLVERMVEHGVLPDDAVKLIQERLSFCNHGVSSEGLNGN